MDVSVIIPTYNRQNFLRELLASLAQQSYPANQFEVIIVDDGSTDGTAEIAKEIYPFNLRYFWQTNQGDAAARNTGVNESQAEVLVFLDDDILVDPDYLTYLVKGHKTAKKRIIVGTEYLWLQDTSPLDSPSTLNINLHSTPETLVEYAFQDVCSNNMSLKREDYHDIGMMQSLDFPGSNIWCDVDFTYQAYKKGFQFYRSTKAICFHRDYTSRNLQVSASRQYEVAYRAVALFQKYPDLLSHIPMFRDKTPVSWRYDSLTLIIRKLARQTVSVQPILKGIEQIADLIRHHYPSSLLLKPLHRWIIGGYLFQGYRKGLCDYGPIAPYITKHK